MLRERNETYMLLFALIDMLAAFGAFWTAFAVRFFVQESNLQEFYTLNLNDYLFIALIITISQVVVFYFIDMYRPGKIGLISDEFNGIFLGVVLTIFMALGVIFFLKTHRYSRLVLFYFGVIDIVFVSIGRSIARAIIHKLHLTGRRMRELIVIGTGNSARQVEYVIHQNSLYGSSVVGFISIPKEKKQIIDSVKILGSLSELSNILNKRKPYHVIFAVDEPSSIVLEEAMSKCNYEGIHMHVVPSFSELITAKGRLENLEGLPLITIRDIPARRGLNRFVKRIFDSFFSLVFILLFSPLYLLIALAIKLTSKGPVFLKQERVGLDNKSFNLLKFRTMYTQQPEHSDVIWTTKNDPRVTPVGRILRKLSLDEIPQFFNVLLGNMSVVGPRPERPYWVEQFKERYTGYMQRHGMKAGITGWAQINGLRGDTSIEERVAADIYYIENWSFLMDLKIILLTPFKSVIDNNAY